MTETLTLPTPTLLPGDHPQAKLIRLHEEQDRILLDRTTATAHTSTWLPLVYQIAQEHWSAAIRIQSVIRGALARWRVRVLKLERKLEEIEQLKQKQLKKIAQRRFHKFQDAHLELEMTLPERMLARRAERAFSLQHYFRVQIQHEIEDLREWGQECQWLRQQNRDLNDFCSYALEETEQLQGKVNALEEQREHLEEVRDRVKQDVELLQQAIQQTKVVPPVTDTSPSKKPGFFGWLSLASVAFQHAPDRGLNFVASR